ncbi:hypothetical protein BJX99DRAFT_213852 [Aspergillus californicus]
MPTKILITGATGAVASRLTAHILALPSPPSLRLSTRNKAAFTPPTTTSSPIEVVQADLTDPTTYATLFAPSPDDPHQTPISHVFLYAPLTPVPSLDGLLTFAKDAGVQHIVLLSSFGVEYLPGSLFEKHHSAYENAIQASGVRYTILRPGSFMSNAKAFFVPFVKTQEGYQKSDEETLKLPLPHPDMLASPIADDDMAAVALTAIMSDKLVDEVVDLCGPVILSPRGQVDLINALRAKEDKGLKPVEIVTVSPLEWPATVSKAIPGILADQLLLWWGKCDGVAEQEGNDSERITGVKALGFEEWLELNKEVFLSF